MSKLANLRRISGLSQSSLAALSGVNLRTLQQYEINQRCIDSAHLSTLCSLASVLCCTLFDLLESEELADKLRSVL